MDGNHPKRRKDKYDPYTISTTEDGRHWLTFLDGQGDRHCSGARSLANRARSVSNITPA